MKAVFLDHGTLGPDDIDTTPLLRTLPGLELLDSTTDDEIAGRIESAEVVLVNKIDLSAALLRGARQLKLICLAATGTDNIALDVARELDIAVCNIRDYCTPSVVEHVFALILALTRRLGEYEVSTRAGAWQRSDRFSLLEHPIRELAGKTLGIIGLGSLGSGVARIADAFGMHVVAARRPYDRNERDSLYRHGENPVVTTGTNGRSVTMERVSFNAMLETSDVISLHCPLNIDTGHLIDARALAMMRTDALLINTARGGLVDSSALIAALQTGQIGGAGIDVLRDEPPGDGEPLLEADLPNLIVTPHIAWAAREARQRAVDEMAANVAAFLRGESRNRVV